MDWTHPPFSAVGGGGGQKTSRPDFRSRRARSSLENIRATLQINNHAISHILAQLPTGFSRYTAAVNAKFQCLVLAGQVVFAMHVEHVLLHCPKVRHEATPMTLREARKLSLCLSVCLCLSASVCLSLCLPVSLSLVPGPR